MASVGSLALCCIVSSVASMTRVSSSGVSPAGSRCTETRPEHFLRALGSGRVSTNVFLRRIHNFALDMTWLPWPVIPKKQWPAVHFKEKRAITWEEHQAIIAREPNLERKAFYQLAWNLGASQSDLAHLKAEDIDRRERVIRSSSANDPRSGPMHERAISRQSEVVPAWLPQNTCCPSSKTI